MLCNSNFVLKSSSTLKAIVGIFFPFLFRCVCKNSSVRASLLPTQSEHIVGSVSALKAII